MLIRLIICRFVIETKIQQVYNTTSNYIFNSMRQRGCTVDNLEKISCKIENLRAAMNELIIKDPELKDPKILIISQELDEVINLFCEILKTKG
ncbi:MAG: aspartyl-phosphate phosphatase Spo0E family protein [Geosporobacter ferrireducens]|nr:aspartyl-phosphate phosphatase Spo0E family protein [Geosporobacter ferrireducens]